MAFSPANDNSVLFKTNIIGCTISENEHLFQLLQKKKQVFNFYGCTLILHFSNQVLSIRSHKVCHLGVHLIRMPGLQRILPQ